MPNVYYTSSFKAHKTKTTTTKLGLIYRAKSKDLFFFFFFCKGGDFSLAFDFQLS